MSDNPRQLPFDASAPEVRALLDGRKTQHRFVAQLYPSIEGRHFVVYPPEELIELEPGEFRRGVCHYGSTGAISGPYDLPCAVGDQFWVREDFATTGPMGMTRYYATDAVHDLRRRRPAADMERWASRLTLTVTDVRVQRLQDISVEDARAEGIYWSADQEGWTSGQGADETCDFHGSDPTRSFRKLWDRIHGDDAWASNPWVAAVTFSVERRNIDAQR